ncbi:Nramp family divalent metal transporter [Burkholderia lata]|uniref:Divalent metal cation transporter MntH n=1 Tax=Burkholderia lata (strain ATCC 17760 / DSM 23089 / LMG 22485 / NCIMB 9086 / R18194 / 383) TaxID=482957 RepID=Q39PJ1_BURL3|nr:Nramp family divalent metal transporter [Burkholderia lata]ABB05625.1 Manganese/iron transporter, NRAMP family [Burkholderia lata]
MNEAMIQAVVPKTLTEQTCSDIRETLAGRRRGARTVLSFAGPAVVASIAYMDPGNFATNIQAGAGYGYTLLWVVALANVVAMLFQSLSAKLGLVTGRNLAELCRDSLPRRWVIAMWGMSEVAAMATDLAEFVGGAIGVSLLLHLPMIPSMLITAAVTYGLLQFEKLGFRPLELAIAALIGVIGLSYLAELLIAPVHWPSVALHSVTPSIPDSNALTISVGIIGATVMPHVLFLHSGLTQNRVRPRNDRECSQLLAFSNVEVVVALGIAGLINMAMVIMASSAFHLGHADIASIETAWRTLTPLLGGAAAGLFLTALIASGISSSVVGTMAGQMIMQGFVGFRIPVWVRRLVTMAPAFIVVASGVDATRALVLSQVMLSIALPVPMIALVWFTSRRDLMGRHMNRRVTTVSAVLGTLLVLALNGVLLVQLALG